jgi:hypothetical protein
MELLLGSHVREHGNRVGQLAGFELEPAGFRLDRIVFSPDGTLGASAMRRPPDAISHVHDDGAIELRPYGDASPPSDEARLLSASTRLREGSRRIGHLLGLDLDAAGFTIESVFVKPHWWSRRTSIAATRLDLSSPGEIIVGPERGSRAA